MQKRTMGLLISHKNNEKRRAILQEQVKSLRNPDQLYFETGYGESVGITDEEYVQACAHVVSRAEAMKCDSMIIDDVIEGNLTPAPEAATVIKEGRIQDWKFREARGLLCR